MKPICVSCQRFYRLLRNGIAFIEGMPKESGALPGTDEPEKWKPYKMWFGDLWECKGCGAQTIAGTGLHPVAEHYQPGFEETCKLNRADIQINDC